MRNAFCLMSLGAALLTGLTAAAVAADAPKAVMPDRHRALFKEYCHKCHAAEKQEGKFRVDDLPSVIADLETAERWQKVLNALNSGEMPPADEPQPPAAAKADLLDDLAGAMVAVRKTLADQHGQITMRRLNRREYRATLRELLGVEINVSELPSDVGTGGFDTVGSNLFMSSNQFEQYLALGREALDEAFERQAAVGMEKHFRLEAEETNVRIRKFYADNLDAYARALQWIKAIDTAAARPENAEVVAEIRKTAKDDGIFRRSWKQIAGAPAPEEFGFKTGENNADKANRAANYAEGSFGRPYHEYYLRQPTLDSGAYLTIGVGNDLNSFIPLLVPFGWPVGDYVVRVRVAVASDQIPRERRFLEFGIHPRHGQVMSTHEVTAAMDAPQIIEIPLTLTRKHGERDDRTLFIREKGTADHFLQTRAKFDRAKRLNGVGPEVSLWVDWFEIERRPNSGKPQPPGLAALEIPLDDKSPLPSPPQVRHAIERFSREAFRGISPPGRYVDRLFGLYDARRKAGDKHSAALKQTLSIVLASPMFLYLSEPLVSAEPQALTGNELAVRLAYFLWGAPPDARLRDLGERGELLQPDVLAAETERVLDDPRSRGFTRAFVYQWLNLDRLDFFEIDRELHPRFDDSVKLAAGEQVYATFEHLLQNNGNLGDLLKADYTIVNGVLANYYGLEGVQGDDFRKVSLPQDSPRGGLLGMAAIHVMGGNGERTSPVERGAWVLRKLLNDPPPPAPANVPQIARLAGKLLTTRERLIAHQEEPQCASCHRKIDPIGYGLENFDAAGLWRTEDSYQLTGADGKPVANARKTWIIDPSAKFHKGPEFRNFFELRDVIASKSDDFARGFSMALVEYALGRPCSFSDEPLVDAMMAQTREKNLSMREFIRALVASRPFHTKS